MFICSFPTSQRCRDLMVGTSALPSLLIISILLQSVAAQHRNNPFQALTAALAPGSGQPSCRMDPGAAHNFCGLPYELSNFQGHFKCDKSVIVGRPATVQELARLVQMYDHVKAVGVGHSWWKEQFCAGSDSRSINIVTTELQEAKAGVAISLNETAMTVTVPAGITQRMVLEFLDAYRTDAAPDGYTLPAYAWFLDQTIGGAVATATHGSSLVFGSLSSQVRAMKVMVANGTVLDLSPATSAHLWRAASASVGRLGITLEFTMSIVKNTPVRREKADITVSDFVKEVKELSRLYSEAASRSGPQSLAVWEAIKQWDATQWFWFIPSNALWRASFTRLSPYSQAELQQVLAAGGPDGEQLLPGAYQQQTVQSVGAGALIGSNARYWSDMYRTFLSANVVPGVLPARQAYLSITEMESRVQASFNAYDQYEAAIPLSKAGSCIQALADELYGPKGHWTGFRAPALLRLIRAENAYLSPASGEPVLYINIEDHLSYATGKSNVHFDVIMQLLRSAACGPARLHWGKAGWPRYAACFDGVKEYPRWCDFGCAVQEVDPKGKFAGTSDVWVWRAVNKTTGMEVDFASCCSLAGFNAARCLCASRQDC